MTLSVINLKGDQNLKACQNIHTCWRGSWAEKQKPALCRFHYLLFILFSWLFGWLSSRSFLIILYQRLLLGPTRWQLCRLDYRPVSKSSRPPHQRDQSNKSATDGPTTQSQMQLARPVALTYQSVKMQTAHGISFIWGSPELSVVIHESQIAHWYFKEEIQFYTRLFV